MFRSEQQPQGQPNLSHIPTQSWYPPTVLSPTTSLPRASTTNGSMLSGASTLSKSSLSHEPGSLSHSAAGASPTAAFASTFPPLRDKSVEDLRKLLTDKEAYNEFLHSLEQVKTLNMLQNDLRKSNIELAKQNLERESQIAELKNQCAIIRRSELASAREKFDNVRQKARGLSSLLSKSVLLQKLQEAASEVDDESEKLHQQLLAGEIELMEFIPKYRKLRALYHKRILTQLAAKTS